MLTETSLCTKGCQFKSQDKLGNSAQGGEYKRGLTHPLTDDSEGHFSNESFAAFYIEPLPQVIGLGMHVLLFFCLAECTSQNKLEWVIADPITVTLGSSV